MKTDTETMQEQSAKLCDLERRIIGSIDGFLTELRGTYKTEATAIARRRLREVQFWLAEEVATLTKVGSGIAECSCDGCQFGIGPCSRAKPEVDLDAAIIKAAQYLRSTQKCDFLADHVLELIEAAKAVQTRD